MSELYYISDEAYNFLIQVAEERGFVRPGTLRKSGMSRFVNRLARRKLIDNRPEDVKESDQERIMHWRVPIWTSGAHRRSRTLHLSEEALDAYIQVAFDLQIVMSKQYRDGPRHTPTSITAAVLEAIGLQWIQPVNQIWPLDGRYERQEVLVT